MSATIVIEKVKPAIEIIEPVIIENTDHVPSGPVRVIMGSMFEASKPITLSQVENTEIVPLLTAPLCQI